jgi:hypothetical protein
MINGIMVLVLAILWAIALCGLTYIGPPTH